MNSLELSGIILQTFSGFIFIVDQANKNRKIKFIKKIFIIFRKIRLFIGNISKEPQEFLYLFTFFIFLVIFALFFWLINPPQSIEETTFWLLSFIVVYVLSYSLYSMVIDSILNVVFKGQRNQIYDFISSNKNYKTVKIKIEYTWKIKQSSKQYQCKIIQANIIGFSISILLLVASYFCFYFNFLNHGPVATLFSTFAAFCIWALTPFSLLSFIYLLGEFLLLITWIVIKYLWWFLVFVWLTGGALLIANVAIS